MNYVSSMLPVLLPIILFFATLIIIFTLRSHDNRSKGLANVKKLLDNYKGNVEASDNSFKQFASELEQNIAQKNTEVKGLIQTVNTQLGELRSYSEDLVRLKGAMQTYREALEGLARLTSDADDKVQTVQNEVDRLDKVRNVIDGFRQDMKDADEHLRKHEQRVIQLERESIARMNQAVSETDSSMDEAMAGLHKESAEVFEEFKTKTTTDTDFRLRKLDDAFQAVIHTVQQFFGELENKIDEARTIADQLPAASASSNSKASSASGDDSGFSPNIISSPNPIPAPSSGADLPKTDLSSEISQLAEPVLDKKPEVVLPKFKAPKFTPKSDDEDDHMVEIKDVSSSDTNLYGSEASQTDDFASFGGVADDSETDFRGMDIMDMDFSTFADNHNSKRWTKSESSKPQWETYGEEETVDFQDDSDN